MITPVTQKTKPVTMRIKDPKAVGNVLYDVPLHMIQTTNGFKEHSAALFGGAGAKSPTHRACLCKLFLEGRCGQGERCKSFHVDPAYIEKCRAERNVTLDNTFINEVVVVSHTNLLFAVRFPAVLRTKGLDQYKKICKSAKDTIKPAKLCPAHNPGLGLSGVCPLDRSCDMIHVKHAELKDLNENRLRTPCCAQHGDRITTQKALSIQFPSGKVWAVQASKIATTSINLKGGAIQPHRVCGMHIKSRCKYGRSCDKLHVCRTWAEKTGLMTELEAVVPQACQTPPRSPKQDSLVSAVSTPRAVLDALHMEPIRTDSHTAQLADEEDELNLSNDNADWSYPPPLLEGDDWDDDICIQSANSSATDHFLIAEDDSFEVPYWNPDMCL